MSDEPNKGLQSPLRRKLLMGAAALPLISMLPRPSFGAGPATATVNATGFGGHGYGGHRRHPALGTGTIAISETGSIQAEKLAIEQINAAGRRAWTQDKFIQEDGASNWPTFAEKPRTSRQHKVARSWAADLGVAQAVLAVRRAVQRHALLSDLL